MNEPLSAQEAPGSYNFEFAEQTLAQQIGLKTGPRTAMNSIPSGYKQTELDRVSQALTGHIKQLAERYAEPLPQLADDMATLNTKVEAHLKKMGFAWK